MNTYIHTYILAYIQTGRQRDTHIQAHIRAGTHIYTNTHIYIQAFGPLGCPVRLAAEFALHRFTMATLLPSAPYFAFTPATLPPSSPYFAPLGPL